MTVESRAATGGVVCGGHPAVAEAGAEILDQGGNAIDAAVAAFFISFHAEPMLASPAGAGFLVAEIEGESIACDFFAAAPGLGGKQSPYAPRDESAFYGVEVDFGAATQVFHIGPGSIAVPGALMGLCETQRDAGRLPLRQILQPAIRACHGGVTLSSMGAFVLRLLEPIVRSTPHFAAFLTDHDGGLLDAGAVFANPELGSFYEQLAEAGSEAPLYHGDLAERLVREVQAAGGGLTAADLASYSVERSQPIRSDLGDGRELLLAAPPSSGGMLIAYGLGLTQGLAAPAHASEDEVLLLRAIMHETLRARSEVIGAQTPTMAHAHALLDGAYLERGRARLAGLLEVGAGPLVAPPTLGNRAGNTTHVSAIDGDGNACAVTISNGECSGEVLSGTGIFLNNFLGEEDLNPEGFHKFPPGARLGSTMTPTLLRGPGDSIAALGSGGSNRIRTAILQVIHHVSAHGMDLAEAVAADRVHYEGDRLYAESRGTLPDTLDALQKRGVSMSRFDDHNMFFGGVHVAARNTEGRLVGIGDARRSGSSRIV